MSEEETDQPAPEGLEPKAGAGMVPGVNPRVGKTGFSPDGLMEDGGGGWSREELGGRSGFDESESLEQLAARVMGAQAAAEAAQSEAAAAQNQAEVAKSDYASAKTEYASRVQEIRAIVAAAAPVAEPATEPHGEDKRRSGGIATLAVSLGVLAIGVGLAWFVLRDGSSSPAADDPAQAAAVVPTDTAAPPAEVSAVPVDGTTPEQPADEPALAPPPAADEPPPPAPVATVEPTPPAPSATPPPPPAMVMHIGGMKATRSGNNVTVEVYIRDAANNAVAGATITGQWSGSSTDPATCSATQPNGRCVFYISKASPPGSLTFTVTGVSQAGATYDTAANDRSTVTI